MKLCLPQQDGAMSAILFWLPVHSRTIFKMTISWEIVGLENTFHNKFTYKHKYDHILLDVFSPR